MKDAPTDRMNIFLKHALLFFNFIILISRCSYSYKICINGAYLGSNILQLI